MKSIKKILTSFLIILFFLGSPTFPGNQVAISDTDDQKMDKLTDIAKKMLDKLSPEDQEKIIQEAIAMEENLKNMPQEQKEKLQKEIDEGINFILSDEFPIDDILKDPEEKVQDVQDIKQPEFEQKEVLESKEDASTQKTEPIVLYDVTDIKTTLDLLKNIIGNLLNKIVCIPRIACEKDIETKWSNLRPMVNTLEKALKIIIKKEKLLSILNSPEYSSLKTNLESLKNELDKNVEKLNPPDTAGLTIVYDVEEDEDNVEFLTAQKQLKEIISILENIIVNRSLFDDLKNFFEKNASEELQKNPEIAKAFDIDQNKLLNQSQNYPYNSGYGYNGGGYGGPYMGPYGYPIVHDFNDSSTSGQSPRSFQSQGQQQPLDKKAQEAKKALDEKSKGESKPGSTKTESPSGKPKDDRKLPENMIKVKINDFSKSLENVSQAIDENKIPEVISSKLTGGQKPQLKKDTQPKTEQKSEKQARVKGKVQKKETPSDPLKEIDDQYDKSLNLLKDIDKSVKKFKSKKREGYQAVIKEIYCRPEFKLEKTFQDYMDVYQKLEQDDKKSEEIKKRINENPQISSIIEKHSQIRKIAGIKDKDDQEEN